jgi:hypothetical protein
MDEVETLVMRRLWEGDPPRPLSVKDAIGEMAASGGAQIVAASRAIADGNGGPFSPEDRPRRALINSFGAGGNFLSAVLESAP